MKIYGEQRCSSTLSQAQSWKEVSCQHQAPTALLPVKSPLSQLSTRVGGLRCRSSLGEKIVFPLSEFESRIIQRFRRSLYRLCYSGFLYRAYKVYLKTVSAVQLNASHRTYRCYLTLRNLLDKWPSSVSAAKSSDT
jgi:hypothetical protein